MHEVGITTHSNGTPCSSGAVDLRHEAPRQFNLKTIWDFDANQQEVLEVALDISNISSWCGGIFMAMQTLEGPDRTSAVGQKVWAHTKGFLPHSFVFSGVVTDYEPNSAMRVVISGDFEGTAHIRIVPSNGPTRAIFVWNVDCKHQFIRSISRALPSLFIWNHSWAVTRACRSMQREIYHRREGCQEGTKQGATFPHNLPFVRSLCTRRKRRVIVGDSGTQSIA